MRQVLLLVESSRSIGRGLLRGIAGYVRAHGNWAVFYQERGLDDEAPRWMAELNCDGVIARLENSRMVEAVRRLQVPTVDIRGRYHLPGVPSLGSNQETVARLAADHLLERGFRRFAFSGFEGADYSDARLEHFRGYLRKLGLEVLSYTAPHSLDTTDTSSVEGEALLHQKALAEWLISLPKPAGIFACNDIRGQQVLGACRRVGLTVPEQIAVIGVDNDLTVCELSNPPLSSVVLDTYKIGFAAASLLDRMIQGKERSATNARIEPLGVEVRQSTDVVSVEDPVVSSALRFIRLRACSGIQVDDVVEAAAVCRRTLERRFRKLVGRSLKEEITRIRLQRVKQLLRETDYVVAEVAAITGFEHPEYLNVVFKRETGLTPGAFRRSPPGRELTVR